MEPEIHDGEIALFVPMDREPENDLCLFRLRGPRVMIARLTAVHVEGYGLALWGGNQMVIRRNNGDCSIADAGSVEIIGRVVWHGFVTITE